jgi:hypothetical protein
VLAPRPTSEGELVLVPRLEPRDQHQVAQFIKDKVVVSNRDLLHVFLEVVVGKEAILLIL